MDNSSGYYILLISVHGLIRANNLELGRDADTGGQTKYVVELARALGEHPQVDRVDLITRCVEDEAVDKEYSQELEPVSERVNIVRISAGPEEYLPKEELWDTLDQFTDNLVDYINSQPRMPDLIHSHYADAGYVGTRLTNQTGAPLVHTGHSLGRVKRRRLLAGGLKIDDIETRYNMSRRIEAEEDTLGAARLVITSTHQEIEEQYGMYDFYQPDLMRVIPPGTDLNKFKPARDGKNLAPLREDLNRFLTEPDKPMILALSRPDHRKNIHALIEAYGESKELQDLANLVIVAGNRDDIREMDDGAREVLNEMLLIIDQHDLYGKVAYPKSHESDDVPLFYQLAAATGGVFINPALTEPFGLTLIEAAACGVPIVATDDGGPKDIIGNCHNGVLIDPLDNADIVKAILKLISSRSLWESYADNGIENVNRFYSWQAHVDKYVNTIQPIIDKTDVTPHLQLTRRPMLYHDRAIFTDLDQNLLGEPDLLPPFIKLIQENRKSVSFGIATGRRLDSALRQIKKYGIPRPDILISSLGTEICYAPNLTPDTAWSSHIDYLWKPTAVRRVLNDLPGLKLQPRSEQSHFKISYYIDIEKAPGIDYIVSYLHQQDISVNVIHSFGQFLDIIPNRANKGYALRWYAEQWDIPVEHILAAGGSGADEDMMRGNTLAVVVANRHDEELSPLDSQERIYFATQPYASGILEAVDYYDFLDSCEAPQNED